MFDRAHDSLLEEVDGLTAEQINFRAVDSEGEGYENSIAMLAHHIADTELFLIGQQIGGEESEIDRGNAFEITEAKTKDVIEKLKATKAFSDKVLDGISDADLNEPGVKFGDTQLDKRQTLLQALIHLSTHAGQITVLKKLQGVE